MAGNLHPLFADLFKGARMIEDTKETTQDRIAALKEARDAASNNALDLTAIYYDMQAEIEKLYGSSPAHVEWNEALARVYRERFSPESLAAKEAAYARLQAERAEGAETVGTQNA